MVSPGAIDVFQHIRVVIAIVLGLGITRLLNGLARFVQHPTQHRVYLVHLGWVFTLLLTLVHFWWWEFGLIEIKDWTFEVYAFLISYATLMFLLCAIVFPDEIGEYTGYEDFFISRRRWFFGIFALTILFDVIDTLIKGQAHFALFAAEYVYRVPVYLACCGIAAWTTNRLYHAMFVGVGLLYEVSWIVRSLETIG